MSKEIILNIDYLESMNERFETVLEKVDTASQSAFRADKSLCMRNIAVKEANDIKSIIRHIIDSFSSTDQKMKEKVQNIVGVEIYNGIAGGGSVHYDEKGNYTIETKYDVYRKKVDALKEKNPAGVIQHYQHGRYVTTNKFENGERGDGVCTLCSNATLVNRRLALDGVVDSDGNRPYYSAQDAYNDHGNYDAGIAGDTGTNNYTVEANGVTVASYCTTRINPSTIRNSGVSIENKLIELLTEHPEGVQFYTDYSDSVHGIVITSYSENPPGSGIYSYMAFDPMSEIELPLTETWLFTNYFKEYSESDFINSCTQGLIYLN